MTDQEHVKQLKAFIFDELKANEFGAETDEALDGLFFQAPTTLRLRLFGFGVLKQTYEYQSFPLEEKLTGRELLTLKYHVSWPYYLPADHSTLHLFAIKQSFVLKLNGGNVKKWLADLHKKNSK